MTEQEAVELAKRLTRIWTPEEGSIKGFLPVTDPVDARLLLPLGEGIELLVSPFHFQLTQRGAGGEITGVLSCSIADGRLHYPAQIQSRDHPREFEEFAVRWGEAFRRNCWLSGCDIEASAHEKAEWIQGFTKEEIDAWNLKM